MRLLAIHPAPNASDTLNCELVHVPVKTYKTQHIQVEQQEAGEGEDGTNVNDAKQQPNGVSESSGSVDTDVDVQAAPLQGSRMDTNGTLTKARPEQDPKKPEYEFVMPKYEALSYRWRPESETRTCSIRIRKNSMIYQFPVHQHLHDALVELRDKSVDRNVWVDALCVDQTNAAERNEQVARMNEVYGEAFNVCIWLGKAEKGSTEALQFLKNEGLNIYDFDERCSDPDFVRRWASLLTLLKRDWFSRRWVVQEVSLAQSATVHCGSTWVNWEDFADAVSLLNDINTSAKKLSEAAKKLESLDNPSDLFGEVGALPATHLVNTANRMFKKSIGGHQRVSTLEQIVARLAMFESGEPRDYIYALLALAKDSQPFAGLPDHLDGKPLTPANKKALQAVVRLLPSAHRRTYNVDYTQEVVDVYQQFMAFALSNSDPAVALDIICRPFAPVRRDLTLPSWIPVVSELPFAAQMNLKKGDFRMERRRGEPFVSMPDAFPQYSAAGRKPLNRDKVRFRKRSDHYSMFVEGFVLDTVAKVEPASQMGNIPEQWVTLASEQNDKQAFWTTLVADRGPKGGVPGIYGRAIKAALEVAHNGLDVTGHMREHASTIVSDALPHVQNTIWGRCLIETSRNHLGLGPKKLEKALHEKDIDEKDKKLLVCIIHGCTVPVILQECKKSDESIAKERKEDEDDRLERQEKAAPIIRRWAERAYRKREEKKAKAKAKEEAAQARRNQKASIGLNSTEVQTTSQAILDEGILQGISRVETGFSVASTIETPDSTDVLPSSSLNDSAIDYSPPTPGPSQQNGNVPNREGAPPEQHQRIDDADAINDGSRSRTRTRSQISDRRDASPLSVYYKVIGESYIHNMMHGEAIKFQNDSINDEKLPRVRTQIFELR